MSNIQFDYSTLSTSISRSELSSIVGRQIVENEYDISEETSTEASSNTSEIYVHPSPPDRYKLVYLSFGLLGIGSLLPWNFFITANDYWMFKFRSTINATCITAHNKTDLQAAFTSYLAVSNNVPYVIFLILCTVFNNRFSKTPQVIASLIATFILFSVVTAFVEINTDSWQIGFFALTILIIILMAIVSAVLSTGILGVASVFPAKYMHIMVLGQALGGIIAAVFQILALLGDCDSIKSGFIYFFSANAVILLTLIAFGGIQKSAFFNFHTHFSKGVTIMKDVSEPETVIKVSILPVLKLIWPYALCVILDFWVTLGIYPGLAVLAVPYSNSTMWSGKLYLPLTCFLLFNVSDFCGRAVGGWMPVPHSKRVYLMMMCALRVVFFPLFMLSNLHPRYNLPILFTSDAYYISFTTMLGFTNGYCVASAMLVGIKSINPSLQEIAGIILSTFLGAGLMLGSFTSYICIKII